MQRALLRCGLTSHFPSPRCDLRGQVLEMSMIGTAASSWRLRVHLIGENGELVSRTETLSIGPRLSPFCSLLFITVHYCAPPAEPHGHSTDPRINEVIVMLWHFSGRHT